MTIQQHASFDSSAAELNATSKLVKAWESKNAKNAAKAGGISMMALSLAACGGSSTTTTTTDTTTTDTATDTTTVVVAPTAQSFALTTATNVFTGGAGDDAFTATNLTLGASDELNGGEGSDTLTVVSTATEAFTMAALKFDSIETLEMTNQSGNVTGATESAEVTFQALAAGQTLVVGGITFTAGTSGATAAQVAAAFADPLAAEAESGGTIVGANTLLVNGGKFTGITQATGATGTLAVAAGKVDAGLATAGWSVAASGSVDKATFTSETATTNVTDLVITGTGVSGTDQVTTVTVSTAGSTLAIDINGVTVAAVAGSDADDNVDGLAAAINGYLGYVAAVADTTADTVVITTPEIVNVSSPAGTSLVASVALTTAYAAPAAPSIATTNGVTAVTTGYAATVDASKITDATTLASVNSTADVTFSNMVSTQSGKVSGNKALTNGDTTFGHKATATTAAIEIADGTTAGDISLTGAGLTSAAITSVGEKNTVGTIDLAAAKTVTIDASTNLTATQIDTTATAGTLTISGAGAVSLGTLDAGFDTVNAAGNSGGLTAAIGGETDTVFTGSSGNDKITASTADTIAATAKLAVNAGVGTDTLVIGDAADVASAGDGDRYTGFEAVQVATDQDIALISGIEAVTVKAASAITNVTLSGMNTTAANAITVATEVDGLFAVTLANATGTSDAVTINATSATATANVNIEDISVVGVEKLTINASTGTSGTDSVFDIDGSGGDKLTSLDIKGSADVDFNTGGGIAKAVAVNSTTTGDLTFAGNLIKGSTVTSGAGKDIVTTTAAVTGTAGEYVSYNTGDGKDSITTTLAALHNTDSSKASVKVEGGGGTDTLIMGATDATLTDGSFQHVTGIEVIQLEEEDADLSFTSGSYINANFATLTLDLDTGMASGVDNDVAVAVDLGAYTGDATVKLVTAADGGSASDDLTVTTGTGSDTVTITAASFAGGSSKSVITVGTGDGDDTITVSVGTLATATTNNVITGGKGADTITLSSTNGNAELKSTTFAVAEGDSTAAAYDVVTGFHLATASLYSDNLDLASTAISADTAGTDGTDAGAISSHAISGGMITFDDAATFQTALVIGEADLDDVLAYVNSNITGTDTVAFTYDSTGNGTVDSTMVFQQGATSDTVVALMTAEATSITATDGATAGLLHIM